MKAKAQSEKSLRKNLLAYSMGAGATLASICPANGSIVYSGPLSLGVSSGVSQSLDLNGGGTDLTFSYLKTVNAPFSYYHQNVTGTANGKFVQSRVGAGQSIDASSGSTPAAPAGGPFFRGGAFQIGPATLFQNDSGGYIYGAFSNRNGDYNNINAGTDRVRGYLPVRLGSGTFHYGWVDFQPSLDGKSATIFGWAYETGNNVAIAAGAVPEPAESAFALGILALGAAGLHRLRKQRQASAQA